MAENKSGTSKLFVRNATGLVRELTPFDAFNLVFAAVLIPVGISQALNFGAAAFPGANIALAFILGAILYLVLPESMFTSHWQCLVPVAIMYG